MSKIVTIQIKDHRQLLDKRFHIMHHIHNQIVSFCIGQMRELSKNKEYEELLKQEPTKERNKRLKEIRQKYCLDEYKLQGRFKKIQKLYKDNIDSHAVQKECTRIYRGIEKCLFHNGKKLHRKRYEQFISIECKTNKAGIRYDVTDNTFIWCHQMFHLKELNEYQQELMLNPISYCGIKRKMFNDGWHYYLYAVVKEETVKTTGSGTVGIDIGTSTVAVCSEERCMLEVLGPEIEKYNKEIEKIQEKIDRSVRASNPERFNEDGTAKRIKGRYRQSKRCRNLRNKLRTVYRKKADYLKQSHEELSNRIMKLGDTFYVEKMSFEGLAKKAEFDEEEPTKKRKRYGRSLNNRAPSELIGILQRKTGKVIEVNTQKYRASQYDHTTGEYEKTELNRRRKQIGEHIVQRDLYSAYLLSHPLDTERPDTEACIRNYEGFIRNHDKCIEEIVKENKPRLSSFGF